MLKGDISRDSQNSVLQEGFSLSKNFFLSDKILGDFLKKEKSPDP